ncbi:MAG: hypothetical protein ACP5GO_00465 [Thermoprotei archaeon]|jgi:hypothetical protein
MKGVLGVAKGIALTQRAIFHALSESFVDILEASWYKHLALRGPGKSAVAPMGVSS